MLVLDSGVWRVKTLITPDYDQAVVLLKAQSGGALR